MSVESIAAATLDPVSRKARVLWVRLPAWSDPRLAFAALLVIYLVLGVTVLGFNRDPWQIAGTVALAMASDMLLHRLLRPAEPLLFPLSAVISGMGLSILLNYAHGSFWPAVAVILTIGSKYLLTFNGRHVFNPTLVGIVTCLALAEDMVSPAPAYQWGGEAALSIFVVTAALALFVIRINRWVLTLSFLAFYFVGLALRAWIVRWHVPPETMFLGAMTAPSFYLFAFFMLPDPATSPDKRKAQVATALAIVLVDLLLHFRQSVNTHFYAAFLVVAAHFVHLHAAALLKGGYGVRERLRKFGARLLAVSMLAGPAAAGALLGPWIFDDAEPGFHFEPVDAEKAGIRSRPGTVLEDVDPRIAHIAKWVLSVGDAVAVADVDNDGLPDLFLTYTLKDSRDRAALYLNKGGFRFERFEIPALERLVQNAREEGLPAGAVFFDWDNDGDQDLLVLVGYGKLRFLENRLVPEGKLRFEDVTERVGLDRYGISVSAGVFDYDRDGKLDLIVGQAFSPYLPAYNKPTEFNVFELPPAQHADDRRMFDFMHRTWHDANNGGGVELFRNTGGRFERQADSVLGLGDHRWTLAIGSADLNDDGWPDLYLANDFGPDQLLLNQSGRGFAPVRGRFSGEVGRDTYKSMNVSIADFDNNGHLDVYVSNVHHPLQSEGSMLWMNAGVRDAHDTARLKDQAAARNALNDRRFGWGAATADLDRDGALDLLQANGMVDDAYDRKDAVCEDYWYWNEKIALTPPDVHGYADRWADLRGRCIFPAERNRVYLNRGRYFVDVAAKVGWDKLGTSRAVAIADFDNDGAPDVIVTHQFAPVSLYRNSGSAAHWIGLRLAGNGRECNRDAIGSRVRIEYRRDGELHTQWREVQGTSGFSAQSDRRSLFGLGAAAGAASEVSVSVSWCGGKPETPVKLAADRYHFLQQP